MLDLEFDVLFRLSFPFHKFFSSRILIFYFLFLTDKQTYLRFDLSIPLSHIPPSTHQFL